MNPLRLTVKASYAAINDPPGERMNTNNHSVVDARAMREKARKLMDVDELTTTEAAKFVCVSRRTWSKYEDGKPMPHGVIKLFWFEVGLRMQGSVVAREECDRLWRMWL